MSRHGHVNWNLHDNGPGKPVPNETVTNALLMDLRDELQKLNGLLHCQNFQAIPSKLDRIGRNTTKPRKKGGGAKR